MSQTLEQDLQYYFSLLLPSEQQSIVSLIKTFVSARTENTATVSLEEYNRELEEANADIESGNFITHEEVKKRLLK